MRALGPLVNWREGKGQQYASFYQNKLKIKNSNFGQWYLIFLITSNHSEISMKICNLFLKILRHHYTAYRRIHFFLQKTTVMSCTMTMIVAYIYYVSWFQPDYEHGWGHLVIVEYGIKILTLDGDMFFLRACHRL